MTDFWRINNNDECIIILCVRELTSTTTRSAAFMVVSLPFHSKLILAFPIRNADILTIEYNFQCSQHSFLVLLINHDSNQRNPELAGF